MSRNDQIKPSEKCRIAYVPRPSSATLKTSHPGCLRPQALQPQASKPKPLRVARRSWHAVSSTGRTGRHKVRADGAARGTGTRHPRGRCGQTHVIHGACGVHGACGGQTHVVVLEDRHAPVRRRFAVTNPLQPFMFRFGPRFASLPCVSCWALGHSPAASLSRVR